MPLEIPRTQITTTELTERVRKINSDLCKTGGKSWTLRVPVDIDNDPDMLIEELCKSLESATEQLKLASKKVSKLGFIIKHYKNQ